MPALAAQSGQTLRVDNIDLHYGASQALQKVNLQARPGEITCILGRNGVGKTSIARAIAGRHSISGGRVVWQGQDISALSSAMRARAGIGYVPRGREIFSQLSVLENSKTATQYCRAGSAK